MCCKSKELKSPKSCLQVSRKILDISETFFGPTLEDTPGKIIFFGIELIHKGTRESLPAYWGSTVGVDGLHPCWPTYLFTAPQLGLFACWNKAENWGCLKDSIKHIGRQAKMRRSWVIYLSSLPNQTSFPDPGSTVLQVSGLRWLQYTRLGAAVTHSLSGRDADSRGGFAEGAGDYEIFFFLSSFCSILLWIYNYS